MSDSRDFISEYIQYMDGTEPPKFYHRWCAIVGIGTLLGRSVYLQHGHNKLHANIYAMLMGEPGARKSSAIKGMGRLLNSIGYTSFAANKTSKETFIKDLASKSVNGFDILGAEGSWGLDALPSAEIAIFADEFNNFIGNGNIEFLSLLGELWDYEGIFEHRFQSSKKEIKIKDPTISILGGNTIENLQIGFPAESLGQGFFSRILFIYGERTGIKIDFPVEPTDEATSQIQNFLQEIKVQCTGTISIDEEARKILGKIYAEWIDLTDSRFRSYSTRRFTHLLKLCIITAASRISTTIQKRDVIYANTILTYTELWMPQALGEFGRGKNATMIQRILDFFDKNPGPIEIQKIWVQFYRDFGRQEEITEIVRGLLFAGKLISTDKGLLPKKEIPIQRYRDCTDYSLLSSEETRKLPW